MNPLSPGRVPHAQRLQPAPPGPTLGGLPSPPPPMSVLIAYCSCPDVACAERIASALVERGIAACVNLVPGLTSIYRWQGAVERSDEVLLLIKTTSAQMPALEAAIGALHPYELPELIAVEAAAGAPRYLDWVRASTSVAG